MGIFTDNYGDPKLVPFLAAGALILAASAGGCSSCNNYD